MNLLVNKQVNRNYEITHTYEAGIRLAGFEVKTLRNKHGSINESYVTVGDEVFLVGAHFPLYQPGHKEQEGIDPYQPRKLLLAKKEIEKLRSAQKEQGLTVVPLRIYEKGNLIKIEIAIARGKKLHDKRKALKDRTAKREAQRAMKNQY
ncbi:SsrA-binding protein SmpB [Patescibacteria group bacterium]|nr:SsrA-binding protein SmpB [Patescibacteria group bacterium]